MKQPVLVVGANGSMGSIITAKLVERKPRMPVIALIRRNKQRIDGLGGHRNLEITDDAGAAMKEASVAFFCLHKSDMRAFLRENGSSLSRRAVLTCDLQHSPAMLSLATGSRNTAQFAPSALMVTTQSFVAASFSKGATVHRREQMEDLLGALGRLVIVPQEMIGSFMRAAVYPAILAAFLQALVRHDGLRDGISKKLYERYVTGTAELWQTLGPKGIMEIAATPGGLTQKILSAVDFNRIARKMSKVK